MPTVLAFGTYNVRKHPRVGILIDGLRKQGITVAEVNHPLELSTAERVEILKKPWKLFGFAAQILGLWRQLRRDTRAWVRANGEPDAVLVGYLGHFDVLLARRIFPHVPIVLDHLIFAADTAKDRGEDGIKVKLLSRLDHMALGSADLVLLDTAEHEAMLPADLAAEHMVVPVGAPDEWFEAGAAVPAEARERGVVFYGLYTPLQGVPVIARALVELHHRGVTCRATLIGRGQDFDEVQNILGDTPDVEFVDWVEPEELPSVVARHAVALGIFSTTPKGLHVVPNKVYQSLAAGCAVITSDTPPQRRELDDGAVFVEPGDASALADAIEHLLADDAALRDAQARARETAQCFSSEMVSKPLAAWIERTATRRRE